MLNRREFTAGIAALTAAEALARVPSDRAAEIYARSFVLDCNSGADFGERIPPKAVALSAIRESGLTAVKTTLGGATGSFEMPVGDVAMLMRDIEAEPQKILQVRRSSDLDRAKHQRKMGIIFSFESAAMLGNDLGRIDTFRNLGVLVMQLTYNRTTPFGVGCLDGDGGLTPLGREAVKRMNDIGVAIDVSHANTQTTAEAIAASVRPVVVSHSGCRAVYMHPRNKEDRELRALAERGGVIGIYMLPFLAPSPVQPTLEIYMDHMTHALKVCGEDHVGVGSDGPIERFPDTPEALGEVRKDIEARQKAGVSAPGEDRPPYIPDMNGPRKMEKIAAALLKRGYPARTAEKVLGANFRRVFGEIWID